MSAHGLWQLGELIGVGFTVLALVLLAVVGTAAALVSGRAPHPVPPARQRPVDRVETVLFERWAAGDIDASDYYSALARAAETVG